MPCPAVRFAGRISTSVDPYRDDGGSEVADRLRRVAAWSREGYAAASASGGPRPGGRRPRPRWQVSEERSATAGRCARSCRGETREPPGRRGRPVTALPCPAGGTGHRRRIGDHETQPTGPFGPTLGRPAAAEGYAPGREIVEETDRAVVITGSHLQGERPPDARARRIRPPERSGGSGAEPGAWQPAGHPPPTSGLAPGAASIVPEAASRPYRGPYLVARAASTAARASTTAISGGPVAVIATRFA